MSVSAKMCPVDRLKNCLKKTRIPDKSEEYKFRAVSKEQRLRKSNKPISYTRIRETFSETLKAIGLRWRNYGLHILRARGATLTANNGFSDRLFKQHGIWKSQKS